MKRRYRNRTWLSHEASYIASIVTPGSRFNYDWRCVWTYVDMQLRSCVADIGADHPAAVKIQAYLDGIADQET